MRDAEVASQTEFDPRRDSNIEHLLPHEKPVGEKALDV
jgi:hypothetical protein